MNKKDLQQIGELIDSRLDEKLEPIKQTLEAHQRSLVLIEDQVRILPDIASMVAGNAEKLSDHEDRIHALETPLKV